MNTSSPAAAPAAAPSAASAPATQSTQTQTLAARTTVHDRASALLERLQTEDGGGSDETGGEASGSVGSSSGVTPEPSPASPAGDAANAGAPDDTAKRREDRLARIAKVRAEEQAAKARRQSEQQAKQSTGEAQQLRGEVEKLRARLSELEPMNDVFRDEAALLAAAEARGMSVEKLAQWMRTKLTDPSAVAQRQAQTVEEKLRAEIEAEREARKKLEERISEDSRKAAEERERVEAAQNFVSMATAKSAEAPFTAKFLQRHGAQGLVAFANQFVVPLLPESYTVDELHDYTEQLIEEFQFGSGESPQREAPANGTSLPSKSGADQPVTTLSSAIPAERSMVTEAVPLHKMSLDERARFLKDKYSRE